MSVILENKLSNLINEIKEIKKKPGTKHRLHKWKSLGKEISSQWNKISAVEEINMQREKSW